MIPALIAAVVLAAPQGGAARYVQAAKKAEAARDFATAEQQYEKAVILQPDAELFQRLGLVRHLQNKFAEAIPAFEKSIALKPDQWGSHLFLGIDYYRTNQFGKALPHLQKALKLRPGESETRFWLAVTYLALKRYLEGLAMLEELSAAEPQNKEVLRILTQGYSDYSVALQNDVVEKHPDSAVAHQIHGQALENEGALDEALKEYRTAQSLDPKLSGVQEAIDRILAQRHPPQRR